MPRLAFRGRLFFALLFVSAIPLVLLTALGVYSLRHAQQFRGIAGVAAVDSTARPMFDALAGTDLPDSVRATVARHRTADSALVENDSHSRFLTRIWPQGATLAVFLAALLSLIAAIIVAGWLARQYSAPLDEVVAWTGRIRRHEALPADPDRGAIPEFGQLQAALRELQQGLEQARSAELEAERLRAFGEVARRVAHEMKNPLTPIRLALAQLARRAPEDFRDELEVIAAESARLEAMAREFAELGRLPEGVASAVDLRELMEDLLRNTIPDGMVRRFQCEAESTAVQGHYDPLRRAFSNILRNAVEACHGEGAIAVTLRRHGTAVQVAVSDSGPGIAPDKRELIFRPYYTEKGDGTGLGLAIVRQTIEQHRGTITVTDTPGGGATFLIDLPTTEREAAA
ncbi:MAG TPA: HAMP domain-containing sensor histidine kinase [Gemmatimonadales bacterium]|nr:HAMP domain-containing sensor histidine kinase [Gemmatimonadales bacterium]